jgi:heme-degrading monooxygenase HmoA
MIRTIEITEKMTSSPGLLGFAVRRSVISGRVWTLTFWSSEAALRTFVTGEVHREAVRDFAHA